MYPDPELLNYTKSFPTYPHFLFPTNHIPLALATSTSDRSPNYAQMHRNIDDDDDEFESRRDYDYNRKTINYKMYRNKIDCINCYSRTNSEIVNSDISMKKHLSNSNENIYNYIHENKSANSYGNNHTKIDQNNNSHESYYSQHNYEADLMEIGEVIILTI